MSELDKEILDGFSEESNALLTELEKIVDRIADSKEEFPKQDLAEFAQKIDRIMGAAKTLAEMEPDHVGLKNIARLCEMCKTLGYKSAGQNKFKLLPILSSFFADVIEVVQELIENLENVEKTQAISKSFSAVLKSRLEWLTGYFKDKDMTPEQMRELMKQFGL